MSAAYHRRLRRRGGTRPRERRPVQRRLLRERSSRSREVPLDRRLHVRRRMAARQGRRQGEVLLAPRHHLRRRVQVRPDGRIRHIHRIRRRHLPQILADRKHGYGSKSYANGDFYEGYWRQNVQEGHGCYVWRNGNQYIDELSCGRSSAPELLVCRFSVKTI